jgi:predicted molibdopterin-dependent oxidoreductase YjgC
MLRAYNRNAGLRRTDVQGQLQRLGETGRASISFEIDGRPVAALAGDTLLVAILTNGRRVRVSEFGDGARAGFCFMGACQDCWVWTEDGRRLRACTTPVEAGLRIVTDTLGESWPNLGSSS